MVTESQLTRTRMSDSALRRFEDIRDLLPSVENPTPLVRVRRRRIFFVALPTRDTLKIMRSSKHRRATQQSLLQRSGL
jgi:hypothetical protein